MTFTQLTSYDIARIPGLGQKSPDKALKNLLAVKEVSLPVFIGGFDIEGVSVALIEPLVAAGFDTLEKLRDATVDELSKVDRYGTINSDLIIKGIQSVYDDMKELLNTGKIKVISEIKVKGGKIDGLSFAFTGKLNTMSRDEANKLVQQNGGSIKSSVSAGLDFLVTNTPNSGSSKNTKALQLGTKIITEDQFLEMLD